MTIEPARLEPQFAEAAQQHRSALFGMWVFLATEVLFFGGLLAGYSAYRLWYPEAFIQGSHHLDLFLGTLNTGVLLLSSFTMAVAVHAAEHGNRRWAVPALFLTATLGAVFLAIKGYEWQATADEGFWPATSAPAPLAGQHLFFAIYYALTGLHAFHLLAGVLLVAAFATAIRLDLAAAPNATQVEVLGLYWHFVDLVWVFLFPLLYLVERYAPTA